MVCAFISTIMLGLLVLRVFADFDLVNPKHVGKIKILRPCGLK